MSECIPWDQFAEADHEGLSATRGGPARDARLVIAKGTLVFDVFHTTVVDAVESWIERSAKKVDADETSVHAGNAMCRRRECPTVLLMLPCPAALCGRHSRALEIAKPCRY